MTVLIPAKDRNQAGARLIPRAVMDAVEFLEIDRPVVIKWAAGLRRSGCCRYRNGTHVITVSTYLDAAKLSRTLWHELIHAVQLERYADPKDFATAYRGDRKLVGYDRCRFEVEARQCGDDFAAAMPLAEGR